MRTRSLKAISLITTIRRTIIVRVRLVRLRLVHLARRGRGRLRPLSQSPLSSLRRLTSARCPSRSFRASSQRARTRLPRSPRWRACSAGSARLRADRPLPTALTGPASKHLLLLFPITPTQPGYISNPSISSHLFSFTLVTDRSVCSTANASAANSHASTRPSRAAGSARLPRTTILSRSRRNTRLWTRIRTRSRKGARPARERGRAKPRAASVRVRSKVPAADCRHGVKNRLNSVAHRFHSVLVLGLSLGSKSCTCGLRSGRSLFGIYFGS